MAQPEPWLRGPLDGVSPFVANLFYTFAQAREELAVAIEGLTAEDLWLEPHGLPPAGFHIRHMGGAAERLGSYLQGVPLSPAQLSDMKREAEAGATGAELLGQLHERMDRLERQVRGIAPEALGEPREIGRARLPSTAIGLIVHIAEHSQRHLGQAITTVKLVRRLRPR
jgi:hypothetical protein